MKMKFLAVVQTIGEREQFVTCAWSINQQIYP